MTGDSQPIILEMALKKPGYRIGQWVVAMLLLATVFWLQQHPAIVEDYYSRGIYPYIGRTLRLLFGWFPFSIGDTVVVVAIIYVLVQLIHFIKSLRKRKIDFSAIAIGVVHLSRVLLCIYLLFMFLWGMNYYRQGTPSLIDIMPTRYENEDVEKLNNALLLKLQAFSKDSVLIRQLKTNNRENLVGEALQGYALLKDELKTGPFGSVSFKPHLIGKLQSYMGYSGYYFPFSGEAHANLYAPTASLPFTTAHEMAHQLGFALESEANMVAYLVTRKSASKFVQYSSYYAVYQYAFAEYYQRDSVAARQAAKRWPQMVIEDKKEAIAFNIAHESFLQPILDKYYQWYLRQNNQPEGLASYNKVVALLIAYAKRYGWEAL